MGVILQAKRTYKTGEGNREFGREQDMARVQRNGSHGG